MIADTHAKPIGSCSCGDPVEHKLIKQTNYKGNCWKLHYNAASATKPVPSYMQLTPNQIPTVNLSPPLATAQGVSAEGLEQREQNLQVVGHIVFLLNVQLEAVRRLIESLLANTAYKALGLRKRKRRKRPYTCMWYKIDYTVSCVWAHTQVWLYCVMCMGTQVWLYCVMCMGTHTSMTVLQFRWGLGSCFGAWLSRNNTHVDMYKGTNTYRV